MIIPHGAIFSPPITGHTIRYDAIGNPLSYYNGRSYTLRWEMGRQLLSSRVNSRTVYYDYNKDGIRIKKNVSGRYTDRYILDGSKVIGMERTKSGSSVKDVYHFIYDEMGNIWSVICYIGGSTTPVRYYYRTNAQGDVKQIVEFMLPRLIRAMYYRYMILSNQVKMYLNGQSITLFVRLMLEGRMIQMYKLENR